MYSFPGTEAQPEAPANAFGSQQAKSNPAQLSLLQFSPALLVPCTRMCVYSCHPTWAPRDWWIGARIRDLFLLRCTLHLCFTHAGPQGPGQGQCAAGAQGLLEGKTERDPSSISLGTARKKEPQFPGPASCLAWSSPKDYEMESGWHPAHPALGPMWVLWSSIVTGLSVHVWGW